MIQMKVLLINLKKKSNKTIPKLKKLINKLTYSKKELIKFNLTTKPSSIKQTVSKKKSKTLIISSHHLINSSMITLKVQISRKQSQLSNRQLHHSMSKESMMLIFCQKLWRNIKTLLIRGQTENKSKKKIIMNYVQNNYIYLITFDYNILLNNS